MAFQTAGARHTASLQGKPRNLAELFWNPPGTLWSLVEPLWNFCGPQGHPGPSHSPRRTSQNLVELLKLSWNLTSNHPGPSRTSWDPGTFMEPYLAEPVEPWSNPGGTLVEPSWNPRGTLPQPRTTPQPSQNLVESLVETWWNRGGTLVEPWWKFRGTLQTTPEPPRSPRRWWNPGGTLVEPYLRAPRTTPEPIWAETPKLSAVGGKKRIEPFLGTLGSRPHEPSTSIQLMDAANSALPFQYFHLLSSSA